MNKEEESICTVYPSGNTWALDGTRHRIGGPAVEWDNGYKAWYLHGERHRLDGPAVENKQSYSQTKEGYSLWYVNDALTHTTTLELSVGQSIPWHNVVALVIKQINHTLFQVLIGNKKLYLFSLANSEYTDTTGWAIS